MLGWLSASADRRFFTGELPPVYWPTCPHHHEIQVVMKARVFGCLLGGLVFVFLLSGCAASSERQVRLAQTAPKMTRLSDRGYYAACGYESSGGHPGPWIGPLRSSRGDALADGLEHDRAFPGHRAAVVAY